MSQAFFVIPGLLLPQSNLGCVDAASEEFLRRLISGATCTPIRQQLCPAGFPDAAHWLWCWRVLTRQTSWFSTAPYRWQATDAPELPGEIWRLGFFRKTDDNRLTDYRTELSESDFLALETKLRRPFLDHGFILQSTGTSFFLSRKKPWGVIVPEAETLCRQVLDPFPVCASNPDDTASIHRAVETLQTVRKTLETLSLSGLDIPWIDGGGAFRYFYPPTKIRSVLSDDSAILGWALASGILLQRIGRLDGATDWPSDAPNGSRIVVFNRSADSTSTAWRNHLALIVERTLSLMQKAKAKGCEEAVIVGCGHHETVTWSIRLTAVNALWARLSASKLPAPKDWIIEHEAVT